MNKNIKAKNMKINEHIKKNNDYKGNDTNAEISYKAGIIRAGNNMRE